MSPTGSSPAPISHCPPPREPPQADDEKLVQAPIRPRPPIPRDFRCHPTCPGQRAPTWSGVQKPRQNSKQNSPFWGASKQIPKKSDLTLFFSQALAREMVRPSFGALFLFWKLPPQNLWFYGHSSRSCCSHHYLCELGPWSWAVPTHAVLQESLALGLVGETSDLEALSSLHRQPAPSLAEVFCTSPPSPAFLFSLWGPWCTPPYVDAHK